MARVGSVQPGQRRCTLNWPVGPTDTDGKRAGHSGWGSQWARLAGCSRWQVVIVATTMIWWLWSWGGWVVCRLAALQVLFMGRPPSDILCSSRLAGLPNDCILFLYTSSREPLCLCCLCFQLGCSARCTLFSPSFFSPSAASSPDPTLRLSGSTRWQAMAGLGPGPGWARSRAGPARGRAWLLPIRRRLVVRAGPRSARIRPTLGGFDVRLGRLRGLPTAGGWGLRQHCLHPMGRCYACCMCLS
jgi:hypothetical protein